MRESASVLRTLDLPGGSLVPFTSVPGQRVRILYGHVWLTEEGNPHDAFLGSGEEVDRGGRGLAVIEALGPARVQLYQDIGRPSIRAPGFGAQRADVRPGARARPPAG